MRDVLVTGGGGFIGSNLVEKLLEGGVKVTVLDSFSTGRKKNLEHITSNNLILVEGDIRDKSLIENLTRGKDVVYHLAAVVSVPESVQNPQKCFEVNLNSSINLMDNCLKNNSKFVFASSAAVYGEDDTLVKTEDLNTGPLSPYGISKRDVEELCRLYNQQWELEYTCFRNFNVYGPRQDVSSAYAAVIPSFIVKMLEGEEVSIFGDGTQTRDFIYVSDVVDAFKLAGDNSYNDVFNLGCNEVENLNSLVNRISSKLGEAEVKYLEERPGDIKHSRASSEKFREVSGWEPRISLDEGINKTIEYYKNEYK